MRRLAAIAVVGVILAICALGFSHAQVAEPETIANQLRTTADYYARGHKARALAKDKSVPVHVRTATQLQMLAQEIKEPTSHERIHGGIASITEYLQGQYVRAMADIGPDAIPLLRKHLSALEKSKKREARDLVLEIQCVVLALGFLKAEGVRPHIEEILLQDEDGMQRAFAAYVLYKMGSSDASNASIPALMKALRDRFHVKRKYVNGQLIDYYPVRDQAARALCKLGVKLKRSGWDFQVVE